MALRNESIVSVAGTWAGHFPITTKVLQSFVRRAEAGDLNFSPAESWIYTACGFWAAVKENRLLALLESNLDDVLRESQTAFAAIGAEHLASSLGEAIDFCANVPSHNRRRQYLLKLEDRLGQAEDSVDQLIAGFAFACVAAHWESERLANNRRAHIRPTLDFRQQIPS